MERYIVEFIGTFIFLFVILNKPEAIPIGIALVTAIYFGGNISGGHFNPAVSVMANRAGKITNTQLPGYIIAQVVGGLCALWAFKYLNRNNREI